jgi:hypothetical protein
MDEDDEENEEKSSFTSAASKQLIDFVLNHRDILVDHNTSRAAGAVDERERLWKEICATINDEYRGQSCTVASCKKHFSYKQGKAKKLGAEIRK